VQLRPVDPDELDHEHGRFLVKLARRAVEYYFQTGQVLRPPEDTPPILWRPGAVFVTIETYLPGGRRGLYRGDEAGQAPRRGYYRVGA